MCDRILICTRSLIAKINDAHLVPLRFPLTVLNSFSISTLRVPLYQGSRRKDDRHEVLAQSPDISRVAAPPLPSPQEQHLSASRKQARFTVRDLAHVRNLVQVPCTLHPLLQISKPTSKMGSLRYLVQQSRVHWSHLTLILHLLTPLTLPPLQCLQSLVGILLDRTLLHSPKVTTPSCSTGTVYAGVNAQARAARLLMGIHPLAPTTGAIGRLVVIK